MKSPHDKPDDWDTVFTENGEVFVHWDKSIEYSGPPDSPLNPFARIPVVKREKSAQ